MMCISENYSLVTLSQGIPWPCQGWVKVMRFKVGTGLACFKLIGMTLTASDDLFTNIGALTATRGQSLEREGS